jgi:membrane-associated protease RseP (regulator of RpoE activity)
MDSPELLPTEPVPGLPATDDSLRQLRARVVDLMTIEDSEEYGGGKAVAFTGKLRVSAQDAYDKLKARFGDLGYIPVLREHENDGQEVVMAVKGDLKSVFAQRPWINLVLFAATVVTTTLFGGMFAAALSQQAPTSLEVLLYYGLPFSATLLAILGVHELGHYFQARRHGVPVTLPFFIPIPLPGTLGTFGAFIQMRGAVENKRALFDVGLGGPIAGLFVAVPLFIFGLLMSTITDSPAPGNRSPLVDVLISVFRPDAMSNGILLNPVLLAARFGLVITAINLLPVGQLDGGHIAYAALGRKWARWLGYATIGLMAILGITASPTWFVWLAFALFSGVGHAQPLNDITPLDLRRNVVFIGTAVLFLSLFTARPF